MLDLGVQNAAPLSFLSSSYQLAGPTAHVKHTPQQGNISCPARPQPPFPFHSHRPRPPPAHHPQSTPLPAPHRPAHSSPYRPLPKPSYYTESPGLPALLHLDGDQQPCLNLCVCVCVCFNFRAWMSRCRGACRTGLLRDKKLLYRAYKKFTTKRAAGSLDHRCLAIPSATRTPWLKPQHT